MLQNTMFMMAQFTPDDIQILTCGTDRNIAYWETLDCSLVREIEGSSVGTLNCIDISPDGRSFITGSNDCTVKIWEYETADITHIGVCHAAIITGCKFSPDGKKLVTTSADGAIMIWKYDPSEIPTESAAKTEGVLSPTTPDKEKSSPQIAEAAREITDQTKQETLEKSASLCTSKRNALSCVQNRLNA